MTQDSSKSLMLQITGFGLIFFGVFVMFISVFQVYRVFTKAAMPVQFFSFPAITLDPAQFMPKVGGGGGTATIPGFGEIDLSKFQQQSTTPSEPIELFSSAMLNDSANLGATMLLFGFILNFGYKLAELGIHMVRPIVVKANG